MDCVNRRIRNGVARQERFPDLVVVKHEAARESEPEPGLIRRVMAYNDKLFSRSIE